MTQDLSVQSKRPSAIPYAVGGAAVGTAAGWGLSKIPALQGARYSSWKDILRDSKDLFEAASKDGASDTVKDAATAIKTAKESFINTVKNLGEHSDAYKNLSQYAERGNAAEAFKTKFADFVAQAKDGKLGFDAAGKTGDELSKAAKEYVNKLMKNGDEKVKDLSDALKTLKDKNTALSQYVSENKIQVFKETSENIQKTVKEASGKAWEAVKDKVKDFKAPKTKSLMIGGAVVGLLLGALLLRPKNKEQA